MKKNNKRLPRGIRNNNPLNIRRSQDKWQGLREVQNDPSFCQFKEMKWGVRAGAKILQTYQRKYGLKTLRQIINRFAPPTENDTSSYIISVSRRAKIHPDVEIDTTNRGVMNRLIEAMWYVENGQAGDPYAISQGLTLAGL